MTNPCDQQRSLGDGTRNGARSNRSEVRRTRGWYSNALLLLALAPLGLVAAGAVADETRKATFAGGCFWCMEPPYDKLEGVKATVSGYTGGDLANPSYEQVSGGGTGHAEAVRIEYDPDRVSYGQLLVVFWHNIDPVAVDRQFCDRGSQYRSAIFYHNERQRRLAERSKRLLAESGRFDQSIATEIAPAKAYYRAEDYHQDYYEKSSIKYKFYRWNCGRDQRLQEIWGDLAGKPDPGEALAPILKGENGGS
ncbi:peptide-methionine (S)-S-oxide reductase MsrA [Thiohalorhabdus sp.]|uniref:peptide-methionine (S)-S-oxide reductase MsrA n=1 Tax=Thiohalorhabdus sp. TaxID=3094134 RepID=UPI002FC2E827